MSPLDGADLIMVNDPTFANGSDITIDRELGMGVPPEIAPRTLFQVVETA